jgi:hypothetical protein
LQKRKQGKTNEEARRQKYKKETEMENVTDIERPSKAKGIYMSLAFSPGEGDTSTIPCT